MAYIPPPQRPQTPNGFQIAGQAVQQIGQAFSDDADRQAKLRALMEEMTQKRAAAILAKEESQLRQKQMEQKTRLESEADTRAHDFALAAAKGKVISPTLAADPSLARRSPAPSAPMVPGGPTREELADLENVEGLNLPSQRIQAGSDATAMMGEALDRQPVPGGTTPFTREEMAQRALEMRQLSPKEYLDATKPVIPKAGAIPLTPEIMESVEIGLDEIDRIETQDRIELTKAERQRILRRAGVPYEAMSNKSIDKLVSVGQAGGRYVREETARARTAFAERGLDLRERGIEFREEEEELTRRQRLGEKSVAFAGMVKAMQDLDQAVGGIYSDKPIPSILGRKVLGGGFGSWQKFSESEEGAAIRIPLYALINKVLKREAGTAVTENEFERIKNQFGVNMLDSERAFRLGIRLLVEQERDAQRQLEAGFGQGAKSRIRQEGGYTSDDVPAPAPAPKTNSPAASSPDRDPKVEKRAEALRRKYNY